MSVELPDDLAEAFDYLDELRESGVTNMFGAAPYLQSNFEYSRDVSRTVLSAWMGTFDIDTSAEDRAETAYAKARGETL